MFRHRGPAWRASHAGHVSLGQLKVMSAIERCRTAALGGHVERCEACAYLRIAYNSCRNRHCPKCQAVAAKEWLADRQAEILPVPYFHIVFTLPRPIADIAYQNNAVVYDLLLKTAAQTLITIAADPKHLGARIGLTAVFHTWGSALTHHPHAHIIVPGGGFSTKPVPAQAGGPALDCLPAPLLSIRPSALTPLPSPVPGKADCRLPSRAPAVLRRPGRSGRASLLHSLPCRTAKARMGRLCQATLWRTRGCARLPVPLHSPDRYCQQPDRRLRPASALTAGRKRQCDNLHCWHPKPSHAITSSAAVPKKSRRRFIRSRPWRVAFNGIDPEGRTAIFPADAGQCSELSCRATGLRSGSRYRCC
jgi:hypothetical protein